MEQRIISTKQDRMWQGIPAIERAPNGRLWCSFFSGGPKEPDPDNYIIIVTSSDEGATWSEPRAIAKPAGKTRAYDPALWHDPDGRLWLFYNCADLDTGTFGVWAMTTGDSTAREPRWHGPQQIALDVPFAFRLNKPTVISTGEWLLPVTWSRETPKSWFAGSTQLQGVAVSGDRGRTWTLHGAVEAPEWALENMIVEHADSLLWMLIRTGSGVLWKSVSNDHGLTWSEGALTEIVNPGSRFFIRRLASGRLLLINTPDAKQRKSLCAYIGESDGREWGHGLELDSRNNVSYPDAVQAADGRIYAVHDHDRQGIGEIILSIFSESEILGDPTHEETA